MTNTELIEYLKYPEQLDKNTMDDIQSIVEKYPFFQTARLLHTRNLFNNNSSGFDSYIHLSAAYVADRKVLYDLLQKPEEEIETTLTQKEIESTLEKTSEIQKSLESEEPKLDETVNIEKNTFREVKENLNENISDVLSQQISDLSTGDSDIELIPDISIDIRKEYGRDVDLDDRHYSLKQKESIIENNGKNEEAISDTISIQNESSDLRDENNNTFSEDDVLEIIESSQESEDIKKHVESETKEDDSTPSASEDIISFKIDDGQEEKSNSIEWLDDVSSKKEKNNQQDKANTNSNDLIDSFIQNGSSRIVPNEAINENIDISEDSVKEHDGFITDTLARIYLKQGHINKAISAYEKLILKYPEKSSYFADQIYRIKNSIKNK